MIKAYRFLLPVITILSMSLIFAGPVFAWPTRGLEYDCKHIHWEMQNDKDSKVTFVGKITEPIQETVTFQVEPGKWGVLDKTFSGLSGQVKLKASISMGGDTRKLEKTMNCWAATSPSPSASPVPSASPQVSLTPTPASTPLPM